MDKADIRFSWDHQDVDPSGLKTLLGAAARTKGDLADSEVARLFGPGTCGVFAFSSDTLVGMARAYHDSRTTAWLADLGVDPGWLDHGIDRLLLDQINDRFRRSALYCAAPAEMVEFFTAVGIKPKRMLVACHRPPGKAADEPGGCPGIAITHDHTRYTAAEFDDVFDSVGFGMSDEDPLYPQFFGPGTVSYFAETGEGRLVGVVRAFSDDLTASYVAEICVHPDWQRRGVGRALVKRVVARFSHTAIWTEAFPDAVRMFESCGIAPDPEFVGCSRAPLE
jgi:GNAT superfamily N-acetyltransferase